ncbi:hypothetical protein I2486_00240 [Cellulophaga sp. E16_2]|nr:hypothetical protein [Cellulophaga sp. E16_2]
MKKILNLSLIFTCLVTSCQIEKKVFPSKQYSRHIGDSEQNNEDDFNFKVCNGNENIYQYFNLQKGPEYLGEKCSILKVFNDQYKPIRAISQDGLIRIRFVVNCEGKAGRFRVLQSDNYLNEFKFNKKVVNQLLEITKSVKFWEIYYFRENPIDYYFYLIFKIEDGQIKEILP